MIKVRTFNPHISAAELFKGVKAGAVSGLINGSNTSIIINTAYWVIWRLGPPDPMMPRGKTHTLLYTLLEQLVNGTFIGNLFFGLIFGLIFSLIFVALYDKLPGKTPKMKGIVISIIYWFTIPLGFPVLYNLNQGGIEGLYRFFSSPYGWSPTVLGLGTSIIWGWLLGYFWKNDPLGKLLDDFKEV